MSCKSVFAAALTIAAMFAAPTSELFDAIQNNQIENVQKLLKVGVDVNARDARGATALMHAAMYASPAVLKMLLDNGANPNLANDAGSTPLMLGIGDIRKVRMLIDASANVNAVVPRSGMTALLIAARRPESAPIVDLLVAKGADVHAVSAAGLNAVSIAAAAGNPAVLKRLLDKGVSAEVIQKERGFEIPNLGSEILEAVGKRANRSVASSTVLMAAVASDDPEVVKIILQLKTKPNVNAATGTGITALFLASPKGNPEIVRMLLDAGADPNVQDERGFTPLILAAGSETRNSEVVRLLIAAGAKLDAKDQNGETAITWARKLGDTAVTKILREAGATGPDPEVAMVRAIAPENPDVRRSVEKALALLEYNGPLFFKKSGCISCHNVSIPLMAMNVAREHGFKVDTEVTTKLMKAHLATLGPHKENMTQGNCTVPGLATTTGYALISMKDAGYPRDAFTDSVVNCLAYDQRPDGHWRAGDTRPPLGTGEFAATALPMRAMQLYMPEARRAELTPVIERARKWLASNPPTTNDDRVFKVLGLSWSKAPATEIQKAARLIVAEQRSDGGWSQLSQMSSDAFATAQALVALHEGAGMPVTDPVWQRGVQYLLRTQLEDGSWHVKSRAFGFQPYFESGFPHGHDQWISAAATSWATIALVYAAEPKEMAQR